ncbi:hypothetical protein BCEP4_1220008 [Burkholderia cepacia]|nr:hypothetical protein BCEP4_1220008 [Burkholderia cepacia]
MTWAGCICDHIQRRQRTLSAGAVSINMEFLTGMKKSTTKSPNRTAHDAGSKIEPAVGFGGS